MGRTYRTALKPGCISGKRSRGEMEFCEIYCKAKCLVSLVQNLAIPKYFEAYLEDYMILYVFGWLRDALTHSALNTPCLVVGTCQ